MQSIILDDHGHAWEANSSALRHFLRCPLPDFDFLRYIVDNLGFVAVTSPRPGAARIRMRFETAAPSSIAAAIYLVADMGAERILISSSDANVVDRLFSSISQAAAYIDRCVSEPHWQATASVQSRQLAINSLTGGRGPLSVLLGLWASANRTIDPARLRETIGSIDACRFVALEQVAGRLTIADLGFGFDSFSQNWQKNAVGMPIEDQPDYEYGRWVQSMYGTVLTSQQPRLDDIDALIRRPHLNDRIRICYQRLILPIGEGEHGASRLIGASLVSQSTRLAR